MLRDSCYSALHESNTSTQRVVTGGGRNLPNRLSNGSTMSFENGKTAAWSGMLPPNSLNRGILLTLAQSVLIHAAAGGVGIAAIRICKGIGAKVTPGILPVFHFS